MQQFYNDQPKYSTIFQVLVNETRYMSFKNEVNKQHSKEKQNIVIIDRSLQATQFFINILIKNKKINIKNNIYLSLIMKNYEHKKYIYFCIVEDNVLRILTTNMLAKLPLVNLQYYYTEFDIFDLN